MSNLSSFLGGSGGGSGISDVTQMPVQLISIGHLKSAAGGVADTRDANGTFFTTRLSRCGAVATVSTSNAWVTAINITSGSGWLFNAISPEANGTGRTTDIRITLDGVAHTISASPAAYYRLIFGPVWPGKWATTTGLGIGGANTNDWAIDQSDGYPTFNDGSFLSPVTLLGELCAGIRFESSLKVEFRISTAPGDNTLGKQGCGVTYLLDQGWT